MSRHEEHERVRQRLGGLAVRERSEAGAAPAGPACGIADRDTEGRWDDDELVPRPGDVRPPGWLEPGSQPRGLQRLVPERFRGARVDPGRRGALALGAVGVLAVVCTGVLVLRDRPVQQSVPPVPVVRAENLAVPGEQSAVIPAAAVASQAENTEVVVSVVGLVERPGLHRLPGGSRIADAIEIAGGAGRGADLAGVNLAQRLADGDQVVIGTVGPDTGTPRQGSVIIGAGGSAPAPVSGAPPAAGSTTAGAGAAGARVDLNTATAAELDALPGVGPVTAKAILDWRTANGSFTDVAQLSEVDGIGPARLARLRDLVTT
ncbi:helix-hairpin-helix domain-containing protein [Nocardia rhizosphaerae]|uniref:Helix-hairpin-helix domain-containing protein n=1 Tax=Nocardia rhizosphaerae TaxID=1691571 RepID=A0ABV8LAK5_9NOCA